MSGSGDYISREAALNVVNGWRDQLIPTYGKNDEYVKCLETVAEHLESLLAADVRPVVRGKWEPDYDYAEYDFDGSTPLIEPRKFQDGWKCSSCGGYTPSETSFCPNCGADMREES